MGDTTPDQKKLAKEAEEKAKTQANNIITEIKSSEKIHLDDLIFFRDELDILQKSNPSIAEQFNNLHLIKLLDNIIKDSTELDLKSINNASSVADKFNSINTLKDSYTAYTISLDNIQKTHEKLMDNPAYKLWATETFPTLPKAKKNGPSAFFITPVQRMPRYPLLINELIKTSSGLEKTRLEHALDETKKVLTHINEKQTKMEIAQAEKAITNTSGKIHINLNRITLTKEQQKRIKEANFFSVDTSNDKTQLIVPQKKIQSIINANYTEMVGNALKNEAAISTELKLEGVFSGCTVNKKNPGWFSSTTKFDITNSNNVKICTVEIPAKTPDKWKISMAIDPDNAFGSGKIISEKIATALITANKIITGNETVNVPVKTTSILNGVDITNAFINITAPAIATPPRSDHAPASLSPMKPEHAKWQAAAITPSFNGRIKEPVAKEVESNRQQEPKKEKPWNWTGPHQ